MLLEGITITQTKMSSRWEPEIHARAS